MPDSSAITAHLFIRPGTQRSVFADLLQRIAALHEGGVLCGGDHIWVNLDIPTGLWALTDVSTYIHLVDQPRAGWARINFGGVSWARSQRDTANAKSIFTITEDLPMPAAQYDSYTVCFRNGDPAPMRAQFSGGSHHSQRGHYDFEHGPIRVIDMKLGNVGTPLSPHPEPSEFARHHAGVRGLDLLARTTGPAFHKVLRTTPQNFTVTIDPGDIEHVQVLHGQIANIADMWVQPVIDRMARLASIGEFSD